jgi:hypothetical protein
MDLAKIIQKLCEERTKLDKIIEALEQLHESAALAEARKIKKPRGRKFMDEKDRREVSERMKKYWAARRKKDRKELGPTDD